MGPKKDAYNNGNFFLEDFIFLLLIIMRREVRVITRKGRKAIKF